MDPAAVPCKPRGGAKNGPAGMVPAGPSAACRLRQQKQVSPAAQVLGQL